MPKVRSTKRTGKSKPYTVEPKLRRTKSAIAEQNGSAKGTFPFLKLPYDIRSLVYGFAKQNHSKYDIMTSAEEKDQRRIAKGRKSLLLVSRQINEEFTPFFYRSATVIVHTNKRDLRKVNARIPGDDPRCNAEEFEEHYLEQTRTEVLQKLRKIEYSLNPLNLNCDNPSYIDHEVVDFAAVLSRYEDVLPSLSEVVVFGARGQREGENLLAELFPEQWAITDEERFCEELD